MTGSMVVQWHGPFIGEVKLPNELQSVTSFTSMAPGASATVLSATASQMFLSDPGWWTVVGSG